MTSRIEQRERSHAPKKELGIPRLTPIEDVLHPDLLDQFSRAIRFEDFAPGKSHGFYVFEASRDVPDTTVILVQQADFVTVKGNSHERTRWSCGSFPGKIPQHGSEDDKGLESLDLRISRVRYRQEYIIPAEEINAKVSKDLEKVRQRKAG